MTMDIHKISFLTLNSDESIKIFLLYNNRLKNNSNSYFSIDYYFNRFLLLSKDKRKIFSKDKFDIGFHDKTKFKINTGNHNPIKRRPYRIPYAEQFEVDNMIKEMKDIKIIRKSKSPWAFPFVIVQKKDGTYRFCFDYRKLNEITIRDNYPLPLIEETIDSLEGSKFFSSLDKFLKVNQQASAQIYC
ncbi:unnamed protein product [Brachionus calyciflorus]|uniref:Uncharacterized protein n=1 Tax=Brachionus calyciflorus TaxID=104777 RepID=A0A814B343_9BILA|nr:unnamed protein product [Brachionus calyciflorus]